MKNRNSRSGVTLIEILIAVSLLSLLTLGILIAMRLGFSTMSRTDARLIQNRRVVNSRRIIESEIDGFMATMANYAPAPNSVRSVLFFEAEPQSMRFVASYSLQDASRGRAQVVAFRVIPGERNEGVRLIVNEAPWTGAAQTGQMITGIEADGMGHLVASYTPILPGAQSFVLADRLRYCRFSYLENIVRPPQQIWRAAWVNQALPAGIRIEMDPLDSSPSDLHVTTVTVPIRINRLPAVLYGR